MVRRGLLIGGVTGLLLGLSGVVVGVAGLVGVGSCGSGYARPCPASTAWYAIAMALGIAALTGGIIATVFAGVLRNSRGPMIGPKAMMRLASSGRAAVATVQTVSPTAMRTGLDRWVVLSLRVQPDDDSPPYDASITALLPWWVMARPGQRYPAAVDPSDPHRVALLFVPPSLPEASRPR